MGKGIDVIGHLPITEELIRAEAVTGEEKRKQNKRNRANPPSIVYIIRGCGKKADGCPANKITTGTNGGKRNPSTICQVPWRSTSKGDYSRSACGAHPQIRNLYKI